MDEEVKIAYRHLGLTGYAAIESLSSNLKVGAVSLLSASTINQDIRAITDVSKWLGKLMGANVDGFKNFDEELFWSEHKDICETYSGYNFETYRELFKDSSEHARKNS